MISFRVIHIWKVKDTNKASVLPKFFLELLTVCLLLSPIVLTSCLTSSATDKKESAGAVRREINDTFGTSLHPQGLLQTEEFYLPLPLSWTVRRDAENKALYVSDGQGERVIELYSLSVGQKLTPRTAGEHAIRSLPGTPRDPVPCTTDKGRDAVFYPNPKGPSVFTVDLVSTVIAALGADRAPALFPYMSAGHNGQEIRVRRHYSFHSLDTEWKWHDDLGEGFVLYHPETGAVFSLYGKTESLPESARRYFDVKAAENDGREKGSGAHPRGDGPTPDEAGSMELLWDTYRAETRYRTFVGEKGRRVTLSIEAGGHRHYAVLYQPSFQTKEVRELLERPPYKKLLSYCLHLGEPYSVYAEDELPLHLKLKE